MPFNGSGVFSIINTFTPGTTISSSQVNANYSDIATGLSDCLTRDGQSGMTAALKLINGNSSVPALTFASEPTLGFYRSAAATMGLAGSFDTTGDVSVGGALTVAGHAILPVGLGPLPWSGTTAPTLWVLAYGQSLLRASYPAFWTFAQTEIAGGNTLYTNGDGSTTFTVPDLRGRIPAGKDNMGGSAASRLTTTYYGTDPTILGDAGGGQNQTLTLAQLPTITSTGSVSVTNTLNIPGTGGNVSQGPIGTGGSNNMPQSSINNSWGNANSFFSASGSFTSSGTSGNPHPIVQPSIITNYIIYAGA